MGENQQQPVNHTHESTAISPGQEIFGGIEQLLKDKDATIHDLTRQIKHLKAELEVKECVIDKLTRAQTESEKKKSGKKSGMQIEHKRIIAIIQLFHIHSGDNIKEIEEELKCAMKLRLNNIDFSNRKIHSDINISQKLIVLCIISSRFGTDAENAIKHIKSLSNAALVIIHVKESHAVPYRRSRHIFTGEKFKDLGGIFDLAYIPSKGIYQCKMNDEEFDGIANFLIEPLSTMI